MNADSLLPWLDRTGFEAGRVLGSVLWQSSLLLLLVAAIAWFLRRRRAAVRHALWAAAVALVPLLPLLGYAVSLAEAPQAPIRVMPMYAAPAPAATTLSPAETVMPSAAGEPTAAEPPSPPQTRLLFAYPWAMSLAVYAMGAAALLALVVVGRLRLGRWARTGRLVTEARALAAFRAAQVRFRLPRSVIVVESRHATGPMTVGTVRPVVVLPAGFVSAASDAELAAVAVHELAHVGRRDALVLGWLSLVRAVLFFHPLVWLACRQVAALAEAACDDAVLETTAQPLGYAKMLARMAEATPRRALAAELAAGFLLSKGSLLRRVEAILSDRRDRLGRLSRAALAATVLAAAASVALALALPLAERTAPEESSRAAVTDRDPVPLAEGWGLARTGLQTRLVPEDNAYTLGKAVRVRLELRNVGEAPQTYRDRPFDTQEPLEVRGPAGRPVPYIAGPCQVMVHPETIEPGQMRVLFKEFDVANDYLMIEPGRYTIWFKGEPQPVGPGEVNAGVPQSGRLTIQVGPGEVSPRLRALKRLIDVTPSGWFFGAAEARDGPVTPNGREAGRGMRVYYGTGKGPGSIFLQLCVTDSAVGKSAAPLPSNVLPSEYLGATAVGHAYLSAPAGTEIAWPRYRQTILAALNSKPLGPDAGEAGAKESLIEAQMFLVPPEGRRAIDAMVPDDLFDKGYEGGVGVIAGAKAAAFREPAPKRDPIVGLGSPRLMVRDDQQGTFTVGEQTPAGASALDDKNLRPDMRLLVVAARTVPESAAVLVRVHAVFRRKPDNGDARVVDRAEAWADRVLKPDEVLVLRAPVRQITTVNVGTTSEIDQGGAVYVILRAKQAPGPA